MSKTIEQNFADWESDLFGFGYGTGEPHTLAALKKFFDVLTDGPYDYRELEAALGPTVTWLLINLLCSHEVIEYGGSPRFGWLTPEGIALQSFMCSKSVDELVEICTSRTNADDVCAPDACNCGPQGYQDGVKCPNPFWVGHH